MKFGRIFAGFVMVCAVVSVTQAEVSADAFATAGYVQEAYKDLNSAKQEKLTNSANAGTNISIDDTTKKISLDLSNLPQVSGNSANGVYVLTATVENGVATLKWEKIERDGNQVRDVDVLL